MPYKIAVDFWFLHGVQGKFSYDVSVAVVGPETSPGNLPCTPCKNPKTKNQYSFQGKNLKSRQTEAAYVQ